MSLTTQPERADSILMLAGAIDRLRHISDHVVGTPLSVSLALTPEETAALIDFAAEDN